MDNTRFAMRPEIRIYAGALLCTLCMLCATMLHAAPKSRIEQYDPKAVPDLTFLSERSEPRVFADYRGDVLLVNVWAVWCVPCVKEMPSLSKLQADYAEQGLKVLAISQGTETPEKLRAFYDGLGINNLPVYYEAPPKMFGKFKARGLPTTIVIDREGREIARVTGAVDWQGIKEQALIKFALE